MNSETFTGKSVTEADKMAIELFNSGVANISATDIKALGIDTRTTFTYSVNRRLDISIIYSESVTLASFKYPN